MMPGEKHVTIPENELLIAAGSGNVEIVRMLLDGGAQVNFLRKGKIGGKRFSCAINDWTDFDIEFGRTPLIVASMNGHGEVVSLLLEHGADVNAPENVEKRTALMFASENGHQDVVATLLTHGADINAVTGGAYFYGCSALIFALRNGHEALAKTLIKRGANLNARHTDGYTALNVSVSKGYTSIAEELLAKGADPDMSGKFASRPLMSAVLECSRITREDRKNPRISLNQLTDLIRKLLDYGAMPSKQILKRAKEEKCCLKIVQMLRGAREKHLEKEIVCGFYEAKTHHETDGLKEFNWSPGDIFKFSGNVQVVDCDRHIILGSLYKRFFDFIWDIRKEIIPEMDFMDDFALITPDRARELLRDKRAHDLRPEIKEELNMMFPL
jgi:ankyrin repeat protein